MRKLYSIEAFGALWSVRGAKGGETTPSFGNPSNVRRGETTPSFGNPSNVRRGETTPSFGNPSYVRRGETTPSFGHPSYVRRGKGGTAFVDERSEAHKGLLSNLPISLLIGGKGGSPRPERSEGARPELKNNCLKKSYWLSVQFNF